MTLGSAGESSRKRISRGIEYTDLGAERLQQPGGFKMTSALGAAHLWRIVEAFGATPAQAVFTDMMIGRSRIVRAKGSEGSQRDSL